MEPKSGKPLFPIGIGTWNIGSRINQDNTSSNYRGVEPAYGNEAAEIEAIRYSLSKGQNHIDCAELYGGFYTDEVVGRAIAGAKREDLYIADKLWKSSVGKDLVRPTVESMLTKLGVDYIDLLYIHAPWTDVDWRTAIPQIDRLIDEGVVRHLGVSNFTIADMKLALQVARHSIVANQMNYNVLYQSEVTAEFREFLTTHGIQLVAYQPVKRQEVLQSKGIQRVAETHNATPAQIALAWLLAKNALPIPKATNKTHIDENLAATSITVSEEELLELDDQET